MLSDFSLFFARILGVKYMIMLGESMKSNYSSGVH